MYTYKNILKQSLNIAIKNPLLWVIGAFAAIIGATGEFELVIGMSSLSYQSTVLPFWAGLVESGILSVEGIRASWEAITVHPFTFIAALLLLMSLMAIAVFFTWASFTSLIALIKQSVAISTGKPLDFKELLRKSTGSFWKVFGLHLALRIAVFILMFILVAVGALINKWFILFFILFNTLALVAIVLSLVNRYAMCGVALKDWGFKESIINGWELVKRHWLITIETAVILFFTYWTIIGFTGYVLLLTGSYISNLALIPSLLNFTLIGILVSSTVVIMFSHVVLTIFYWACWAIVFELIVDAKTNPINSWLDHNKK
jgi:hypothetical protein